MGFAPLMSRCERVRLFRSSEAIGSQPCRTYLLACLARLAVVVDRTMWRPTLQAWLGTTATSMGDYAAAEGSWDGALATVRSMGNRVGEAGILQKRAEASARREDHAAALADFADSAAILGDLGARPQLARVLRGWGETLRAAGRRAESDTTLHRALSLFEEMGIEPEAEAVRESLGGEAQDVAAI